MFISMPRLALEFVPLDFVSLQFVSLEFVSGIFISDKKIRRCSVVYCRLMLFHGLVKTEECGISICNFDITGGWASQVSGWV